MGYREPETSSGPLRSVSWTLVAIGAALLLFICWHQSLMNSDSRRYGIEVPWRSQLLWLFAFAGLELGAISAARRRAYGLSVGISGFVVAILGIVALFVVAQVGM